MRIAEGIHVEAREVAGAVDAGHLGRRRARKIHDREGVRQREGKARVGDAIVESGDRAGIVDAEQVDDAGERRIGDKCEIVRRMRRGRDSQRNRYQQTARHGTSRVPKQASVRAIRSNHVSLLIDACSGVIPWLAVFLVAYASNMRVAFPARRVSDLTPDPEERFPNAGGNFLNVGKIDPISRLLCDGPTRQFNESIQLSLL